MTDENDLTKGFKEGAEQKISLIDRIDGKIEEFESKQCLHLPSYKYSPAGTRAIADDMDRAFVEVTRAVSGMKDSGEFLSKDEIGKVQDLCDFMSPLIDMVSKNLGCNTAKQTEENLSIVDELVGRSAACLAGASNAAHDVEKVYRGKSPMEKIHFPDEPSGPE